MTAENLSALWLTFKLAAVSTGFLVVICLPISWWLSRATFRGKALLEAVLSLPLVLPPTALGFYLLLALAPNGPVGTLFGRSLAFSFEGLVIGSIVYSFPFVVQPMQNAFLAVRQSHLDVAATLGASPFDRFATIGIPVAKKGILVAAALGFAHTLGEFGIVMMIGGSIPGETKTLSIAIYEGVESLDYAQSHFLSAVLVAVSLALLCVVYSFGGRPTLFRR